MRLGRSFFQRLTLYVARELLGQRLVRVLDGRRLSGTIVETEAYVGHDDRASHASAGRTRRNAVMWGPAGHAYVYFIYGMHHCLNVVTEGEGFPAAVLIRAVEPSEGIDVMRQRRGDGSDRGLTNGPARLCQAMAIDLPFNGVDLCTSDDLFIETAARVPDEAVRTTPRVGVRGDELAVSRPWRFLVHETGTRHER